MGLPEPAPLPPPEMPSTKLTDASRINKYIDAVQSQAEAFNPQAAGCIGACKPAVTAVIRGVQFVWPWYMWAYSWIYYYVSMAPRTVVQMIFGIALCFFGGTYVASIAAIEAFRQFGGQKVYAEVEVISSQVRADERTPAGGVSTAARGKGPCGAARAVAQIRAAAWLWPSRDGQSTPFPTWRCMPFSAGQPRDTQPVDVSAGEAHRGGKRGGRQGGCEQGRHRRRRPDGPGGARG